MITVTLFTSPSHLEDERKIRGYLEKNKERVPHQLVLIDITTDPTLEDAYKERVPLLHVGPYHISWPFSQQELLVSLQAAQDRQTRMEQSGDPEHAARRKRGSIYGKSDRFTYWFSSHYMLVFNLLVALYVGLAFAAPMLMKIGSSWSGQDPLCGLQSTLPPTGLSFLVSIRGAGILSAGTGRHQREIDLQPGNGQ